MVLVKWLLFILNEEHLHNYISQRSNEASLQLLIFPHFYPLSLPLFHFVPQGFDPPHQSETRTVYVANRFPQHCHYVPQRFADNRIISSKVPNRLWGIIVWL